jgi:hypothetical protein
MDSAASPGLRGRIPPSRAAEVLAALALLLWRFWDLALIGVWRDWLAILGAFWLVVAIAPDGRWRRAFTAATVLALAAIYAFGQVPHLRSLLSASP